jgi:hypothetical protein
LRRRKLSTIENVQLKIRRDAVTVSHFGHSGFTQPRCKCITVDNHTARIPVKSSKWRVPTDLDAHASEDAVD